VGRPSTKGNGGGGDDGGERTAKRSRRRVKEWEEKKKKEEEEEERAALADPDLDPAAAALEEVMVIGVVPSSAIEVSLGPIVVELKCGNAKRHSVEMKN
jgi:hypothetical protein